MFRAGSGRRGSAIGVVLTGALGLGCATDTGAGKASNAAFGGTSGSGGSGTGGSAAGTGTGGSSGSGGSGGTLNLDGGGAVISTISVSPASAVIEVRDGVASPVTFTVTAQYQDGSSGPVGAVFSFDRPDLASVNQGGVVSATRIKGGRGRLRAEVGALAATAVVDVRLVYTDNAAGLDPTAQASFSSPDANPSGTLLYPYDRTVFPRGLPAPELMWDGGDVGATYQVSISDAYFQSTAWVSADPPSRWQVPQAWWDALTLSNDGASPVQVSVQRRDAAGVAHQAMSETWTVAPGSLRGTIYYWAVSLGAIQKIRPGATAPVPAFDPGPPSPLGTPAPTSGIPGGQGEPYWDDQGTGKRCVACHTVSKDGSRMAALFSACGTSQGGCDRPWGMVDTATEQITAIAQYSPGMAIYSALSPNGSHLVFDTQQFRMTLADPVSTAIIPSALDALTRVAHPMFSPDGTKLAFISGATGGYPVEFATGDLDVMDVSLGAAPYFSGQRRVKSGGGQAIAFPSFSPDSRWVVYQRGNYSRAKYGAAAPFLTGYNDLYLADTQSTEVEIHLAAANGTGTLPPKEAQRNYQPRVNPVAVGGYFWVVFGSPRDYGNRMQSVGDSTNENRKQLWVAAIDVNAAPGSDPSHPAFWLPGQELGTINMDGYWALEPCRDLGATCADGYECCSGFCRDQGDGTLACVDPPTNECARLSEACVTAADCCPLPGRAAECYGGFCTQPGPS